MVVDGVAWTERNVIKKPNKKTILGILTWLEFHHMICRESNGNGTYISICNWSRYQSEEKAKVTEGIPQGIPHSTHTKEVKEVKEKKHKDKHGTFGNVLLSQEELLKLSQQFNGNLENKINSLSEYMESKGTRYKSHYATILAWARRDNPKPRVDKDGYEI